MFQDGSVEAFFTRSPSGPSGQLSVCYQSSPLKEAFFSGTFPETLTSSCTSPAKNSSSFSSYLAGPIKYLTLQRYFSKLILDQEIISLLPLFFSTISSLLTLFSKFFSSFLRSTCLLSVSHTYLALEEVYLPFRAAVPNNPTLLTLRYGWPSPNTGFLPSVTSFFKELMRQPCLP